MVLRAAWPPKEISEMHQESVARPHANGELFKNIKKRSLRTKIDIEDSPSDRTALENIGICLVQTRGFIRFFLHLCDDTHVSVMTRTQRRRKGPFRGTGVAFFLFPPSLANLVLGNDNYLACSKFSSYDSAYKQFNTEEPGQCMLIRIKYINDVVNAPTAYNKTKERVK